MVTQTHYVSRSFCIVFQKPDKNEHLSGRHSGHKTFVFLLAPTLYVLVLPRRIRTTGRTLGQSEDSCGDCGVWVFIRVKSASSHS